MNNENIRYRELAVAIVGQACEDYCMSKRVIDNSKDESELKEAYKINNECLDFFNSKNFRLFSNFDFPVSKLLERLDYLAKNDEREFIRFWIKQEECSDGDEIDY